MLYLRPTRLNISTGVSAFFGSNCGLKGAADLRNWVPSCIQSCGTQATAVPFCISGKVVVNK